VRSKGQGINIPVNPLIYVIRGSDIISYCANQLESLFISIRGEKENNENQK